MKKYKIVCMSDDLDETYEIEAENEDEALEEAYEKAREDLLATLECRVVEDEED